MLLHVAHKDKVFIKEPKEYTGNISKIKDSPISKKISDALTSLDKVIFEALKKYDKVHAS